MSRGQHKTGIPAKPRGQQTGFSGNPDKNRMETEETPALRGRLKKYNEMFADASSQHVGSDPTKPSANSPSVPAMKTQTKSRAGGERGFKKRLKRSREM